MDSKLQYTPEQKKTVNKYIDKMKKYCTIKAAKSAFRKMVKAGGKGTPEYDDWLARIQKIQNGSVEDWRNSSIVFGVIYKDKTDEEVFNSEMAERIFFDECHKLNYYGRTDIENAMRRGEIPVHAIESILENDVGLGTNDYPAIAEGYKGRLNPEAEKKLMKEVA